MERIMKTSLIIEPGVSVDTVFECIRENFFHYPGLVKFEQSIADPETPRIDITFQFKTEEVDVMEVMQKLHQIKDNLFIISIEP